MWQLFKDLSIDELKKVYELLNINYDVYECESQYFESAKEWTRILLEKNIAHKMYYHPIISLSSDTK
jgi:arginyl-tRNA synthetase